MRKGFTLIEIILSVSLIIIISTSTIFFVFNNERERDLNKMTKHILEAANLYASKEVDENGNIYINQVKNGAKGVKIPLSNLVNKGYVDEKVQQEIIDLTNIDNYYIMLLDGNVETEKDYCEDNAIISLASWIDKDKDKDIYLCNSYDGGKSNSIFDGLTKKASFSDVNKTIKETDYYDIILETDAYDSYGDSWRYQSMVINSKQNGLFCFINDNNNYCYFRGIVNTNYAIIKDKNNEDNSFRIISFSSDKITLISNTKYNDVDSFLDKFEESSIEEKFLDTLHYEEVTDNLISLVYDRSDYGEYYFDFGKSFQEIDVETFLTNTETDVDKKVRNLTITEVIMSGIYPCYEVFGFSIINLFTSSYLSYDGTFNINEDYIIRDTIDDTYWRLNHILGGIEKSTENYGTRLVIEIDLNQIQVTGDGTVESPYRFS